MSLFYAYVIFGIVAAFGILSWAIFDDFQKGNFVNLRNPILFAGIVTLAIPFANLFLLYLIYKLATR